MADKPIHFSADMIKALHDGSKTQTRRRLSLKGYKGFFRFGVSDTPGYDWTFRRKDHVWEDFRNNELLALLPFAVGDRLWVKEAWRIGAWHYNNSEVAIDYCDGPRKEWLGVDDPDMLHRLIDQSRTDAERAMRPLRYSYYEYSWTPGDSPCRWRPSVHMPRWASRMTLIVTDVRVHRVQDISEADAKAEGIEQDIETGAYWGALGQGVGGATRRYESARDAFRDLWDTPNAARAPWESKAWVVAYTFTVQPGNIDGIEAANEPNTHRQRGGYAGGV